MIRFVTLACVATPLLAQSPPLVTDRPDQTESAAVVPVGALQIEAGLVAERLSPGPARLDGLTVGGTLLRFGLLPRLELRLAFDGWRRERIDGTGPTAITTSGAGNLDAGIKAALLGPGAPVGLAIVAGTSVPVGSNAVSGGDVAPHGRLALAVPLGDRLGFGANAGAFREADRTDGLYSAVLGVTLTQRVALFGESYGTLPISSGGAAAHSIDGGLTVLLLPTLQVDASGGVGLNAAAAEWFLGVGVSLRVGR